MIFKSKKDYYYLISEKKLFSHRDIIYKTPKTEMICLKKIKNIYI